LNLIHDMIIKYNLIFSLIKVYFYLNSSNDLMFHKERVFDILYTEIYNYKFVIKTNQITKF